MSETYWLGVITTPALAVGAFVAFVAWVHLGMALGRRGFTFEVKWTRDTDGISDYTLRHDIWWERSFGPVFVGGWYREPPTYNEPSRRLFNRWIGVGRADGPCWMAFRARDFGPTTDTPPTVDPRTTARDETRTP